MRKTFILSGLFSLAVWMFVASFPTHALTQAAATAPPTWPNAITVNGASVVVYQPQAIAWPDHETLSTREAIAITRRDDKTPILGSTEISFSTHTNAATGDVELSNPQLTGSHFPTLNTDQGAKIEEQIKAALPTIALRSVPLQSVLLSLKETTNPPAVAINNDPPVIFYSAKPAALVVFDGEPVLAPAGKSGLSFAMNTNWEIFTDGKDWYLLDNGGWLSASAYSGPYRAVSKLPAAFAKLPNETAFAAARKAVPPSARTPPTTPAIFVSTKPAEIIVTDGSPQFVPVTGTGLQSVKNTNSVLFFEPASGRFFLLTSGRWFSAHGLTGEWTFANDSLPPDFAMIQPNSPQGSVLPSVPGTEQAQLAVLQAQVPRQATLNKATTKLAVVYSGLPQFRPIPGTPMAYAVNTGFPVIATGGAYYVCYQGAWFVGTTPNGPWGLATSVPAVIYTIPPTSPLYYVTYVRVYGATPVAVTYGYTAGYTMGFVTAGVVVYGTGYYYPPIVIPGPIPIYYPYPYSYVGNVYYNPTYGVWTRGGTVYGPYGGTATGGSYYNPSNGAYARGGAIYGPNGGVGGFSYYNPSNGSYARGSASWGADGGTANGSFYNAHTGVSGATNQNWNAYSRWGSSSFSGPNQTVNTASGSNARGSAGGFTSSTGAQGAGYRGANGNSGGAVKTQNGDVYAGHDGNVYQHSSNGWSKWNDGGWQPVNPPANSTRTQSSQTSANSTRTQSSQTSANSTRTQSSQTSANRSTQGGVQGSTQGGSTQRGTVGGTQNRTQTPQARATAGGQPAAAGRQTMDRTSYNQLEQDRQARSVGGQSRFGGASRSSGGGGGSGRFRR